MKLKVKIQQVLVARNRWSTDAIPKLPQREIESSTDVDVHVDDVDLEISSFWLHEAENVSRAKKSKSKREKHNTNAADEVITAV